MPYLFSFTDSPIINAMKHLIKLLPGIEKVVTLSYSPETNTLSAKFITDSEPEIQELKIENNSGEIEKIRNKNIYYKWLKQEDIPFEVKQERTDLQMNVFDELDTKVLLLSYRNEHDNKNDLVYIYFKPDLSNFGVSDSSNLLTPEHKKMIGFILYNNVKTLIDSTKNDIEVLRSVNENTKVIFSKLQKAKEELQKTKNYFSHSLTDLSKVYLNELAEKYNRFSYSFSEETIKKIRSYQGDLVQLKKIIEQAVIFVNSFYFDSGKKEIILSEEYFNFDQELPMAEKFTNNSVGSDRYTKTILLLDKLENAARDVVARNMELTGANVGNACIVPISAPAISDALKKHRNKIVYLIGKYENKWMTIRNDFRPVKNILYPKNNILDKTA
jgi:hypothetical protein